VSPGRGDDGGTLPPPVSEDAAAPVAVDASVSSPQADAASPPGPATPLPATFTKRLLDTTTYPNAVCNDGTPAAYYAEAGSSADAPWVILLEGGSWCTSDADCENRGTDLSSSKGLGATITPSGILSSSTTANPHFAGANRIDVQYCTSDVFSGAAGPIGGKTNFEFQGHAVFEAVVSDLKARYGLGAAGQSILLAGVSAGGVSVLVNADNLAAAVPQAKVFALVDAGFLPDVAPLTGPSILAQFQTALPFWKGAPDPACVAKNAAEPARCYLAQYVQPTLSVPLFFGQSLEDPHGPLHAGGFTLGANPTTAQKDWLNQVYTPAMIQLLTGMPAGVGAFSPCQVIHTMADNAAWTTLIVGGEHYDDLVATWFAGGAAGKALATPCSLP
jgi:hypothetical protein